MNVSFLIIAGEKSVTVVSPKNWFIIQQTDTRENFLNVVQKMNDDLILTESRTYGIFPAISLWRRKAEVVANENVAAIFTTNPVDDDAIVQFNLNVPNRDTYHDLNSSTTDFVTAEKIFFFLAGSFNVANRINVE